MAGKISKGAEKDDATGRNPERSYVTRNNEPVETEDPRRRQARHLTEENAKDGKAPT
ncbi:MAG: hypothetical protein WC829_11685 [Hyphomicrobium sp.]|jgi:hypothetical protein